MVGLEEYSSQRPFGRSFCKIRQTRILLISLSPTLTYIGTVQVHSFIYALYECINDFNSDWTFIALNRPIQEDSKAQKVTELLNFCVM